LSIGYVSKQCSYESIKLGTMPAPDG